MADPDPPAGRIKQVIVVNAALSLPPGKLAAQVAHAAVLAFLKAPAPLQRSWLQTGMTKIVLACDTPEALLAAAESAERDGLPTGLIHDAGRTVVSAGTATCVGIGPAESIRIDAITGALRLLA